jgi:ATP-dependent Lhr-like helicase
VLDPTETFIGTINEDFAVESMAGDVFQLGNASWRILRVASGMVRVEDARASPQHSVLAWEAPARTAELSRAVSDLRVDIERQLVARDDVREILSPPSSTMEARSHPQGDGRGEGKVHSDTSEPASFSAEPFLPTHAAEQIAAYFADVYNTLGAIPSQETIVMERFFDESGGMQLVLHSPSAIASIGRGDWPCASAFVAVSTSSCRRPRRTTPSSSLSARNIPFRSRKYSVI